MQEVKEFSAALCRGLIEADPGGGAPGCRGRGFPRLYAAASLKQFESVDELGERPDVFRGFMPRPH